MGFAGLVDLVGVGVVGGSQSEVDVAVLVHRYAERIIKYYLDQDTIIPNVPTYVCTEAEDRSYVLSHLEELVVKATDGAGGYGMLVGPHSTAAERVFTSPELLPGTVYFYTFTAEVVRNGQTLTAREVVPVEAGKKATITLLSQTSGGPSLASK